MLIWDIDLLIITCRYFCLIMSTASSEVRNNITSGNITLRIYKIAQS